MKPRAIQYKEALLVALAALLTACTPSDAPGPSTSRPESTVPPVSTLPTATTGAAPLQDTNILVWGSNLFDLSGPEIDIFRIKMADPVDFVAISSTDLSVIAIADDGTAWNWVALGDNQVHQAEGSMGRLKDVKAGFMWRYMGLASDGTVWEGGGHDDFRWFKTDGIDSVVAIAAGYSHLMALRDDGTVWISGGFPAELFGAAALASPNQDPAQIPGLADIVAISASPTMNVALQSDGSVWIWGWPEWDSGQLVLRPSKIPNLDNVIAVAIDDRYLLALRNDGRVWVYPVRCNARNGLDADEPPIEVSELDDVIAVAAGGFAYVALRSDGTVHEIIYEYGMSCNSSVPEVVTQATAEQVLGLNSVIAIDVSDVAAYMLTAT